MNTNSNIYTIIYTTVVVVIVAAVLAFVSMKLGPSQEANVKAESLRQMMAAAGIESTDNLYSSKNAEVLDLYAANISKAYTVGLDGIQNGELSIDRSNIELVSGLKAQNKIIKDNKAGKDNKDNKTATLPVYVFNSGVCVIPVYGAGLWGPVWGYIAIEPDFTTIHGAYFDHESETPGLGAKIKDEEWFREKFAGKVIAFGKEEPFCLAKNAEAEGADNAVDAITGATMTSKGLNTALNVWFNAYESHFEKLAKETEPEEGQAEDTVAEDIVTEYIVVENTVAENTVAKNIVEE